MEEADREKDVYANQETTYLVIRGERPPVDIHCLDADAWIEGKMMVRFTPEFSRSIPTIMKGDDKNPFPKTGFRLLDSLHTRLGVTVYRNVLHGYYQTTRSASEYRQRHEAWGFHQWFEITFDSAVPMVEAVKAFQSQHMVMDAEPLFRIEHTWAGDGSIIQTENHPAPGKDEWIPNDPLVGAQWAYNNVGNHDGLEGSDIDLFRAWDIERGNNQILISVLDGGIEYWHPDLAANMWEGIGFNFAANSPDIIPDPQGHGTHVAGTVAAVTNNAVGVSGVAGGSGNGDGVRLISCQVFNPDYTAGGFDQAFIFSADNGVTITQNSWMFSTPGAYNQVVLDAIDYFNLNGGGEVMDGGLTIFATGNNDSGGHFYPAYYSGAMAVTATNNRDQRASYANFGHYVDLAAPGGHFAGVTERGILSTTVNGGYDFKIGTSMACPHVSGAAGLLASKALTDDISITPEQIWQLLRSNTDHIYSENNLNYLKKLGTGRLNAYRALKDLTQSANGLFNSDNFEATAIFTDQILLSWEIIGSEAQVILLASNDPISIAPTDGVSYAAGDLLDDDVEVIFVGSADEFIHDGLIPATMHYYSIFSFLEDMEYSSGRNAHSLSGCPVFSTPFFENFSDAMVPPFCWERIDLDGDGNNWRLGWDQFTESYYAFSESRFENNAFTPDNWLVTPRILMPSGNMVLSFKVRAADIFNWDEKFAIMITESDALDTDAYLEVFSSTPSSNQWEEVTVNISGYLDKEVHIAFRHYDTEGILELNIKDIALAEGMQGDVNADNVVDILDVVWLIRHLEGDSPDGFIPDAADMNGDGIVDEADLQLLLDAVMDNSVSF